MSHPRLPFAWLYPSPGPAPPSPVVVNTVPEYFGGRPTPPPSPPRMRATFTVDDYAPCPPSPHCIPSSVEEDELQWSNALNSGISQSTHDHWSTSELDHSTSFADPLTNETLNDSGDQARCDDTAAVSDHLIHSPATYAHPSPVLLMMHRAAFDRINQHTQLLHPPACHAPLKLFTLTGGRTPMTGLRDVDQQTFEYYAKCSHPPLFREPESFRYSVSSIETVQRSLRQHWSLVYPTPIPPIIIRSRDLIGPYNLTRRVDGFAFVVPTEDSIWGIVRWRGIDSEFRPLNPSLTVETGMCTLGDASYFPQHIVASKFAVNVFLELADSATGPNPLCEYLGAYVLRFTGGILGRPFWADVDPGVQQSVYNRIPNHFRGPNHLSLDWPRLPHVRFYYYKWDKHLVGFADECFDYENLVAGQGIGRRKAERESANSDDDMGSDCDIDQYRDCDDCEGTASSPSVYSPEPEYTSFIDFSSCA